jgi:hypothetical protein
MFKRHQLRPKKLILARAACVRCHGTKLPLLTALLSSSSSLLQCYLESPEMARDLIGKIPKFFAPPSQTRALKNVH